MNTNKMALAAATGILCASVAFAGAAFAQEENTSSAATERVAVNDALKASEDTYKLMRAVRATRVAIFNGQPEMAGKLVKLAQTDINAAIKDAKKYAVDTKSKTKIDDTYVAFDSDLALSRTFKATPENAKHIEKANEHLKKGEQAKAIEVLKLANIDLSASTASLPIKFAETKVNDAANLIASGKFYEANLSLIALEDSVVIDAVNVDAAPVSDKN